MTNSNAMRHLLIFLPGIMGSVLLKEGRDIWALSGQALWQYLRTMGTVGESLQLLSIIDDDWRRDDLGDGIVATRLIEDLHSVPGLVEHAGYSVIAHRANPLQSHTRSVIHQSTYQTNRRNGGK